MLLKVGIGKYYVSLNVIYRWKQQTQHIKIFLNQSTNYHYISPGKEFATIKVRELSMYKAYIVLKEMYIIKMHNSM